MPTAALPHAHTHPSSHPGANRRQKWSLQRGGVVTRLLRPWATHVCPAPCHTRPLVQKLSCTVPCVVVIGGSRSLCCQTRSVAPAKPSCPCLHDLTQVGRRYYPRRCRLFLFPPSQDPISIDCCACTPHIRSTPTFAFWPESDSSIGSLSFHPSQSLSR